MTRRQRFAERIGSGSVQIGWRILRWPWEEKAFRERVIRNAVWWICLFGAVRLVLLYPRVMEFALVAWVIQAYRSAEVEEQDEEAAEEAEREEREEQATGPVPSAATAAARAENRIWMISFIRARIGDGMGIHVEALRDELVARSYLPAGYRVTALRAALEARGIPVRDQLKVDRVNRMGVHLADLPYAGESGGAATPPVYDGSE